MCLLLLLFCYYYVEWFSRRNGRVVIESATFTLEIDGVATWVMSEEDEIKQRHENAVAMSGFMDRMLMADAETESGENDP